MADISKITLPSGITYDIKDAQARGDIAAMQAAISGGVSFIGETSTVLTDGSTTSTITINNEPVTAVKGYLVVSSGKEFVWDGAKWIEFGDLSGLGTLAYKDTATGNFTPAGTVSQPTFSGTSLTSTGSFTPEGSITISTGSGTTNYTPAGSVAAPTISVATSGSTTNITPITAVGTLPALGATVANENLTLTWDAGSLPTQGSAVAVKTGDAAYSATAPSFTGTAVELVGSFSGTQGSVSVSGTPAGTVSQPTFSGTQDTVTVS